MEHYSKQWLKQAGNRIGHTLRVDEMTLVEVRVKFARVCVEVDLIKPLKAGYRMKGNFLKLPYEALHKICFNCDKYGHRCSTCPMTNPLLQSVEVEGQASGVQAHSGGSKGNAPKTN